MCVRQKERKSSVSVLVTSILSIPFPAISHALSNRTVSSHDKSTGYPTILQRHNIMGSNDVALKSCSNCPDSLTRGEGWINLSARGSKKWADRNEGKFLYIASFGVWTSWREEKLVFYMSHSERGLEANGCTCGPLLLIAIAYSLQPLLCPSSCFILGCFRNWCYSLLRFRTAHYSPSRWLPETNL